MSLVKHLKQQGFSSEEINHAISIKQHGVVMVKIIERFNCLYNQGIIDGFPDSSIEVIEYFYGEANLRKMKYETLFKKVRLLQRCLESMVDEEEIKESVEYYLS